MVSIIGSHDADLHAELPAENAAQICTQDCTHEWKVRLDSAERGALAWCKGMPRVSTEEMPALSEGTDLARQEPTPW